MRAPLLQTLKTLLDQGVTPQLDDALKKRIRLTNGVSLFGALVLFASVPFDHLTAPRWMVVEDVVGGFAFLTFPLLNRRGRHLLSRVLCLVVANLIVLGNVVLLGPDSGASMLLIALCAIPFALFDLRDRAALVSGVLLPIACFVVGETGVLAHLRSVSENYSAPAYRIYSAVLALAVLLFALLQTALANARAEHELREKRETAIHSAKLAALGEMSGNIAHEVNNPLAAILLRTQSLLRKSEAGPLDAAVVGQAAREIEKTVQRIAKIVDSLRTFARDAANDPLRPEPVTQIVQDTVELCAQRFAEHGIALQVDAIPGDLRVDCRGVQISQILLNLLSNAHDAVETLPKPWVRISAEAVPAPPPGLVRLAVTDSGPGIPPGVQARMMEPFFTTKEVGKGTGLGLSVSKGIAEAHEGRLAYDPDSPHTRFVLTLKRSA